MGVPRPAEPGTRRPPQPERDSGAPVIGFGDEIPAFMLIRRKSRGTESLDAPNFVPGSDIADDRETDEDQD